MSDIVLSRFG